MGKEFSNKDSIRMAVIAGSIIGIIGLGVITIHVLLGSLSPLSAIIAFVLCFYYCKDTTVICDEKGFTVKSESKAKGASLHEYGKKPREMSNIYTMQERSFS